MAKIDWNLIFDKWGIKRVTPSDKRKRAYVLSAEQYVAVIAAGIQPAKDRPGPAFTVETPLSPSQTVVSSFYHSERSVEANRDPEARLGRKLISSWLQPDEEVVIGNIGETLYAIKLDFTAGLTTEEVKQEVILRLEPSLILALAKKASAKPEAKTVSRIEFVRDPYVVAAAIHRAKGACEMPDCAAKLFKRDDGRAYLEVHHIVPLSEEGADSIENVAAICPRCHRKQHHSMDRVELREKLKNHITSLSTVDQSTSH